MCWTTRVVFADASLLVVEERGGRQNQKKKEVVLPQPPQDADQADATSKVNVDERAHRVSARGKFVMGSCCASAADHSRVAQ